MHIDTADNLAAFFTHLLDMPAAAPAPRPMLLSIDTAHPLIAVPRCARHLAARFAVIGPEHAYSDLVMRPTLFTVTLSFSGYLAGLSIPYSAVAEYDGGAGWRTLRWVDGLAPSADAGNIVPFPHPHR